jgi:hypothetical protein
MRFIGAIFVLNGDRPAIPGSESFRCSVAAKIDTKKSIPSLILSPNFDDALVSD